jgi:putative endonuclease
MSRARHLRRGARGEWVARMYLRFHGYRICDRNARFGHQELDIVAIERRTNILVFVEVKTRRQGQLTAPRESVTYQKRAHLRLAARLYIQSKHLEEYRARFDVIEVEMPRGKVKHFPDAFGEKESWN